MGSWTLADFRSELEEILGNRGIAPARMNRWINMGKREVESGVDIENTRVCRYFDTVAGQKRYSVEPEFLSVVSIVDETNDRIIVRSDVESLDIRNRQSAGAPEYWARRGVEVLIHPAPDAVYRIKATLILETLDLANDGDKTVFPAYWDNGILMASAHYAHSALGEDQRAELWFGRFLRYMQSRMMDSDFEGQSVSEPVRVARDFSDIRRR